jgi:hypothetical protein
MSEREAIIREIAKKKVVHQLPGMEALPVRRDGALAPGRGGGLAIAVSTNGTQRLFAYGQRRPTRCSTLRRLRRCSRASRWRT